MSFTNMNNPSGVRHLPDDPPRMTSGYKSLREKSPVRQNQMSPQRNLNESVTSGNNANAQASADRTAT